MSKLWSSVWLLPSQRGANSWLVVTFIALLPLLFQLKFGEKSWLSLYDFTPTKDLQRARLNWSKRCWSFGIFPTDRARLTFICDILTLNDPLNFVALANGRLVPGFSHQRQLGAAADAPCRRCKCMLHFWAHRVGGLQQSPAAGIEFGPLLNLVYLYIALLDPSHPDWNNALAKYFCKCDTIKMMA